VRVDIGAGRYRCGSISAAVAAASISAGRYRRRWRQHRYRRVDIGGGGSVDIGACRYRCGSISVPRVERLRCWR
jgi:hypothetical protein